MADLFQTPQLRYLWSQFIDLLQEEESSEVTEWLLSTAPNSEMREKLVQSLIRSPPFPSENIGELWNDIIGKLQMLNIRKQQELLQEAIENASADNNAELLHSLIKKKIQLQKRYISLLVSAPEEKKF